MTANDVTYIFEIFTYTYICIIQDFRSNVKLPENLGLEVGNNTQTTLFEKEKSDKLHEILTDDDVKFVKS